MIKYYTDDHNVDEDATNVPHYGGGDPMTLWVGIYVRHFSAENTNPGLGLTTVASSNMKNFHSYTDHHDVDEDYATIPSLGEHWGGQVYAGLHCRHIDWLPSYSFINVASNKK